MYYNGYKKSVAEDIFMDVITELKQNYAALAELLTDTIGSDYDDALSGYIAA